MKRNEKDNYWARKASTACEGMDDAAMMPAWTKLDGVMPPWPYARMLILEAMGGTGKSNRIIFKIFPIEKKPYGLPT